MGFGNLTLLLIEQGAESRAATTHFYRTRVRSLAMLVTHYLTNCRLVNLIDVTLACKDGSSKLVEVVIIVYVDDEKRVGNSL